MKVLFQGICTHLAITEQNPVHRVVLAASDGYSVTPKVGELPLLIPDHVPMLSVHRSDIVDQSSFTDPRLERLPDGPQDLVNWRLNGITLELTGIKGRTTYSGDRQLPGLRNGIGTEIAESVIAGETTDRAAAFIKVPAGEITAVSNGQARHVVVTAKEDDGVCGVRIENGGELKLRTGAQLIVSNEADDETNPCSANDYLLHYRLTTTRFVEFDFFTAPDNDLPAALDPTGPFAPFLNAFTLSNCSNSIYP